LEELKDNDLDPPSKLTKVTDARDVHEALEDYFSRKSGASGSPLAYVTRETVAVTPLVASIATVGFPSYSEQMIARTRHDLPGFASDSATIWGTMRGVTYGGPGWAWVSAFQHKKDGRAAKLAFSTHYMGGAHTSRIRLDAVRKLQMTFFDSKTRFTMEQYLTVLTSCFTDLLKVGQPYTEVMKMDVLYRTLVAESFKSALNSISLTDTLRENFDLSCVFLLDADNRARVHASHKSVTNRQVSATGRGSGRGGGRGGGRGNRNGHGGSRGGRGHSDGGRGRGTGRGASFVDPKDVVDIDYSVPAWEALTPQYRAAVTRHRELKAQAASSKRVCQHCCLVFG
jgi:hypothetical protein